MHVKNLIPPPALRIILHSLRRLRRLLVPQLHHASWRIDSREDTAASLCAASHAHVGIQIRVVCRCQACQDRFEEGADVVGIADAGGAEPLAREQQLTVRGVEEIGDGGRELRFDDLAQYGPQQGLEEPGEAGEFGLALDGVVS